MPARTPPKTNRSACCTWSSTFRAARCVRKRAIRPRAQSTNAVAHSRRCTCSGASSSKAVDVTSSSAEEWRDKTLKKALERAPERAGVFETTAHIPEDIAYTGDDLAARNWSEQERLGYPGEYPYTRGVQPTMYRGRLWTMRQYAGYASAEESNARYRLFRRGV